MPGIVVFSGGSAANSLVDAFERVRTASRAPLSYVIPISDNGGSTSEILRVFGGPGIGDVRSRLVRLIPAGRDAETAAIRRLFNHRLPGDAAAARAEWFALLEAAHPLWQAISSPKRELVRSHLNAFHLEAVKRMRPASRFDYARASVGNLFLTGARLFTGSFEAAIYLLSAVCQVPEGVDVLPALNSNFAHHIAAGLADGSVVVGQNDISHPSAPAAAGSDPGSGGSTPPDAAAAGPDEDANLPGSLPALRRPAVDVSKAAGEALPAPIERVWYINPYGHEMTVPANPRVLDALARCDTVIFSIGSLFTSIVPSLVLRGVGAALARPHVRNKILILNGALDRETGPPAAPMTALGFVAAIANACADSRGDPRPPEEALGAFVTHLVHVDGPHAPEVDRQRLARAGIDTTRLYGPVAGRYDATALAQTLESIVGRPDPRPDRSRRNTLVG